MFGHALSLYLSSISLLSLSPLPLLSPPTHPSFSRGAPLTIEKIFVFDRYRYTLEREIHILTDDETNAQVLCTALARDVHKDLMYCGCSDGRIVVYSGSEGEEVLSFHGHGKAVTGLEISDSCLWSCSEDGTVCTWNIACDPSGGSPSNSLVSKSDHHGDRVVGLVNVQDRFVLSYSSDGTLLVWDAAEAVPVGVGRDFHSARFSGLVFQVDVRTHLAHYAHTTHTH